MRTWLRRNRWGLLALPLLLLALPLAEATNFYHAFVAYPYRIAVEAPPGGQVDYGDGRMRIVELTRFQPSGFGGEPVSVPAGFTFLHAVVAFEADPYDALGGCQIFLEDDHGRRHEPGPAQLSGTPYSSDSCVDYLGRSSPFSADLYFLLPPGAQPAAIRVELDRERPRFARLRAP